MTSCVPCRCCWWGTVMWASRRSSLVWRMAHLTRPTAALQEQVPTVHIPSFLPVSDFVVVNNRYRQCCGAGRSRDIMSGAGAVLKVLQPAPAPGKMKKKIFWTLPRYLVLPVFSSFVLILTLIKDKFKNKYLNGWKPTFYGNQCCGTANFLERLRLRPKWLGSGSWLRPAKKIGSASAPKVASLALQHWLGTGAGKGEKKTRNRSKTDRLCNTGYR